MLSIGEFSQVTRLTVKTLRYYHNLGILAPERIDSLTGYRYYGRRALDRAQAIHSLKELGFTLKEIGEILAQCREDEDLTPYVLHKLNQVEERMKELQRVKEKLALFQPSPASAADGPAAVREEVFPAMWIAGIRMKGRYSEMGRGFAAIHKKLGRFARGKPYGFYYDMEYVEEGADFEAVVELRKEVSAPGIHCRRLPARRCVSLIHKGPYGSQGPSYLKLFDYCRRQGYELKPPLAEHFLKGPGLIFKGNPEGYLTRLIGFI